MKAFLDNKYFIFFLRLIAGLFFIYAAQTKIVASSEFAQAIRAYDIIPDYLSTLPAIILPWIELYCGVFLVAGFYTRSSAVIVNVLMIVFTLNVLVALLRGLDIDCGCGASMTGINRVSWAKILENSAVIAVLYIISSRDSFFLAFDNRRADKN